MSTWCSKHVEENSILWINNNQCIKLVINIKSMWTQVTAIYFSDNNTLFYLKYSFYMHTSQASLCPTVPHCSSKRGVVEKILKITHRIPEKQNSTIVKENGDQTWLLFAWRITEFDCTSVGNVTSGKQKTDMTEELSLHTVPTKQSQQIVAGIYRTFITQSRLRTHTKYKIYNYQSKHNKKLCCTICFTTTCFGPFL